MQIHACSEKQSEIALQCGTAAYYERAFSTFQTCHIKPAVYHLVLWELSIQPFTVCVTVCGSSNLTLKALSEHVMTLLSFGAQSDSLSYYLCDSAKLSVDIISGAYMVLWVWRKRRIRKTTLCGILICRCICWLNALFLTLIGFYLDSSLYFWL